MRLSIRAMLRLQWLLPSAPARVAVRSRRRSARAALAFGFAVFAVASAALAGVVENARREWRDPEFGHRLNRLRQWKADAPQRPIVLAVGSSRVQQAIDPASMQLPDGSTDPLMFNFGYRGSTPLVAVLNVFRVLDADIRPDFVCVEFSPLSLIIESRAAPILTQWSNRFTVEDVQWMIDSGFIDPRTAYSRTALARWMASSLTPWTSHRQTIVPHWLPGWVTPTRQKMLGTEQMDRYGFTAYPLRTTTTQLYREEPRLFADRYAFLAAKSEVSATIRRAHALMLARCRAEGVAVAFVWVPVSPLVNGWVRPEVEQASMEYAAELAREWGAAFFLQPDWLKDDDFADGEHLLPHAAAKYSRWLADTQLKPWLAAQRAGR